MCHEQHNHTTTMAEVRWHVCNTKETSHTLELQFDCHNGMMSLPSRV